MVDGSNMEYTKQLLLSCLLNVCHKVSPEGGATAAGGCANAANTAQEVVFFVCFFNPPPGCLFSLADVLDEEKFSVELVVQCIRTSDMPQTHHHGLLLLGAAAAIFPVSTHSLARLCNISCSDHRRIIITLVYSLAQEKVLHNIMPIFTFMGANVMRLDDAYSFQVIDKTVQMVIPALIQVGFAALQTLFL